MLLVAAISLAACIYQEGTESLLDTESQVGEQQMAKDTGDSGELVIEDLVVGEGREARNGDSIAVHYVGSLTDGTKFDSSYDRNQPFGFTIGAGQVIKGWDIGVSGMRVGGKRRLTVPPQFAYGQRGAGDLIPANATLIFEIDLIGVNSQEGS